MTPDLNRAAAYALQRLENELPDYLHYHSVAHTRDDVVPAVKTFAEAEAVSSRDHLLVVTAAWFHDLGFVEQIDGHEAISVRIMQDVLPNMGYDADAIATIDGIIMATQMPHDPRSCLQKIIVDADMDSLGRNDFFEVAERLRAETEALNEPMSDLDWYRFEIDFLESHHYFTEAAQRLRGSVKARNLEKLYETLAELSP